MRLLNFPPDHEAVAAFAIGYVGDPSKADPELAKNDAERRPRKEMREMLFEGEWGHRWELD